MTHEAELLDEGRAALRACDWATARSAFEAALEHGETAALLDGLGEALYWQGEYAEAIRLRQRAYASYRREGRHETAAFVAARLAQWHGLIYGNASAVSGWIGHARRMLESCDDCPERGWVELFCGVVSPHLEERERFARTAWEIGRRFEVADLEFDALADLGHVRVDQGAVDEGMALIDEAVAAVAGGLVTDPWAAGEIYCTLFGACETAIDVKRAEEWLDGVDAYVELTGELPIAAICRMHYGGVLTSAGRWDEAERQLTRALEIYHETYRGTRFEPLFRLADLRARQGRLEEAERLLEGYEEHPGAAPALTRLLFMRGELEAAQAVLDRHLPREGCTLSAAPAVALWVHVAVARGLLDDARRRTNDLDALAASTALAPIRGLAARSRARIAVAAGDDDARRTYDEALVAFGECELRLEFAITRLELAELLAAGSPDLARREARGALTSFHRLGASRDADAAADLLRRLGERGRPAPRTDGVLTQRQSEVLDLLAEGLSNAQIAERLFISHRTAEHHVSSILSALNLRSRAEAAAHAIRRPRRDG